MMQCLQVVKTRKLQLEKTCRVVAAAGPGLSAVAVRPQRYHNFHGEHLDSSGGIESLRASQRSGIDTNGGHRSDGGRLPALPSANQRAQKAALREIDEVSQL